VQQAVGRIVREYDGKRQPLVVDFVDELIGICNSLYHKRKAVYRKLNYEIKEIG
jgi:predicted site-specific integrase-resolvase